MMKICLKTKIWAHWPLIRQYMPILYHINFFGFTITLEKYFNKIYHIDIINHPEEAEA